MASVFKIGVYEILWVRNYRIAWVYNLSCGQCMTTVIKQALGDLVPLLYASCAVWQPPTFDANGRTTRSRRRHRLHRQRQLGVRLHGSIGPRGRGQYAAEIAVF